MNKNKAAAWALAAAVLAAASCLGWRLSRGNAFESGLFALLPGDARRPLVGEAISRMAASGSGRVVLLCGNAELESAAKAADAAAASLKGAPGIKSVISEIDAAMAAKAADFYAPWRYRLLSPEGRARLQLQSDAELVDGALEKLYSPLGPPRLSPLESDPFGFFNDSLLAAASRGAMRFAEGRLAVFESGKAFVLVLIELDESGTAMGGQKALLSRLSSAVAAARSAGADEVLRAGFVFHAAEAARQAEGEISTIGLGSLAGILLLMALSFRSLKPLMLCLLPLGVGTLCALGFSMLLFGKLHLLTLVFGTSIIGVAVDYGVLFVSGLASGKPWDPFERRRQILPAASMAVATSLVAYATLACMPFPILRQMGCFTLIGLTGAWLTAMLWLPLLGGSLKDASQGPVPRLLMQAMQRWPRLGSSQLLTVGLSALLVLSLAGIFRLHSNDDVRQLYATAPDLVREQERVQNLLRLPATGQFFIVSAPDEEALLRREESLSESLEALKAAGLISGYQGVSQFVPSLKRQNEDYALEWKRLYGPSGLVGRLFSRLESPETARVARFQAKASAKAPGLSPEAWLQSPLSTPFRPLWLGLGPQGYSSIVTLNGLAPGPVALEHLSALSDDGLEFVDHLASLGALMGRFRVWINRLMLAGYALIAMLLAWRYGKDAWRVLGPTVLAAMATAGLFGWLGLNYNLFCVFGLLLSLDMGLDYGIFMQDRKSGSFQVSLLSASLAACSTLLSFGLLALSRTPALATFGLAVLCGIGGSWLLAPCFCKETDHEI